MQQDTENLDIIKHESALLGAIICDQSIMDKGLASDLSWNDFIGEKHSKVYYAMKSLWMANIEIDLLTVSDFFKKNKADDKVDSYFISGLAQLVPSASNWRYYCEQVKTASKKRKILKLRELNEDMSLEEMLRFADDAINEVSVEMDRSFEAISVIGTEVREHLKATIKHKSIPGAVASGISGLDVLTCGFQKSDLIIVAGRPGKGKTSFAVNQIAPFVAAAGVPVGIFSLEMSRIQLVMRMLSMYSGVDYNRLRSGNVYESELNKVAEGFKTIEALPIVIDDEAGLKISSLKVKAKAMKMKDKIGLLIIDYLQLIDTDNIHGSMNDKVAQVSRNLKVLAKQLDIPIICLSQLSRESERSGSKRPNLIHLRDSGAIEQDADVVMFIHSEDDDKKSSVYSSISDAVIIVAKQRNGPVGDVKVKFVKNIMKFYE